MHRGGFLTAVFVPPEVDGGVADDAGNDALVAEDVEPFRPERRAGEVERERRDRAEAAYAAELARRDANRDSPPAPDDTPIDREPRVFARDPSPEEAACGLPPTARGPRAATAIMDSPKMPNH